MERNPKTTPFVAFVGVESRRWRDGECKSIDALGAIVLIAMGDGDDPYIDADPYSYSSRSLRDLPFASFQAVRPFAPPP